MKKSCDAIKRSNVNDLLEQLCSKAYRKGESEGLKKNVNVRKGFLG